jgi:two-component system CheB/CheR fusion protein
VGRKAILKSENIPVEDQDDELVKREINPFPIVGIGASAGGIEALSSLLKHLPVDLNMAYVVVQHMSPDHESILPELLQKKTEMPVHQVVDKIKVKPNNVYVIPPDTYMSVIDGHLGLWNSNTERPFHTIDYFLNCLSPSLLLKIV